MGLIDAIKETTGVFNMTSSFGSLYNIGITLGKGSFSVVKEAIDQKEKTHAVKIVTKSELTHEDMKGLADEISILKELNHPNIMKLYEVYDEPLFYYLVTELMGGGELFDRIVQKQAYNEREARDVCKVLFDAIGYCHDQNVAHRDLKPQNLLLMSRTNDLNIKIADFGFAKKVTSDYCLTTQCGSPEYVAPEILIGSSYGTKADMWSIGVIIYILLGGYAPFMENNQNALFFKIKRAEYEFHDRYWAGISDEAKELISNLICINPEKRMSASEALESSWMRGKDHDLESHDLSVNLAKFKKFNATRRLRQAVLTVIATEKFSHFVLPTQKAVCW